MLETLGYNLRGDSLAEFAMDEVYPYLREKAMNRFATKGEDIGTWPELRPSTVERRIAYGYGGPEPINKRTGLLEEYISYAQPNMLVGEGEITLIYPGDLPEDPVDEKKYRTAQRGENYPTFTPPRPIIGVSGEDYAWIRERLEVHIMRGIRD